MFACFVFDLSVMLCYYVSFFLISFKLLDGYSYMNLISIKIFKEN